MTLAGVIQAITPSEVAQKAAAAQVHTVEVVSETLEFTQASQVHISESRLGLGRLTGNPKGAIEKANELLQKNHDKNHIFWRDVNGHNHMAHSLLTVLALGGSPSDLERAWEDNLETQRPLPDLDEEVVSKLSDDTFFMSKIFDLTQYTNFMVFFERQIEEKGWQAVCQRYVFARDEVADAILAGLYEGAYHPIIHFGLGVEFEQPSIIAEGLAQAATHSSANINKFLLDSEKMAASIPAPSPQKTLAELYDESRANETIRTAPKFQDFANRVKEGVLGRVNTEMAALASQFRVTPADLERRCAEMINTVAWISGAAQRNGKARKIDFFHMHAVTSSIFETVLIRQSWISAADKVRLIEWKGRLDLVWYVASGSARLDIDAVANYTGQPSSEYAWEDLYRAINAARDDGHVAKFVRALKNGEQVCKEFEQGEHAHAFPIKGDMWLKLARMCYDSTLDLPAEAKWVWGAGYDQIWSRVPDEN